MNVLTDALIAKPNTAQIDDYFFIVGTRYLYLLCDANFCVFLQMYSHMPTTAVTCGSFSTPTFPLKTMII